MANQFVTAAAYSAAAGTNAGAAGLVVSPHNSTATTTIGNFGHPSEAAAATSVDDLLKQLFLTGTPTPLLRDSSDDGTPKRLPEFPGLTKKDESSAKQTDESSGSNCNTNNATYHKSEEGTALCLLQLLATEDSKVTSPSSTSAPPPFHNEGSASSDPSVAMLTALLESLHVTDHQNTSVAASPVTRPATTPSSTEDIYTADGLQPVVVVDHPGVAALSPACNVPMSHPSPAAANGLTAAATGQEVYCDDNNNNASGFEVFLPGGSLNLDVFKVYPCRNDSFMHDRKSCPFYHSERDRRRHPSLYRAEQCDDQFDLDDDALCICPRGDGCDKCHNRHELLYHPSIYKQRFCSSYSHHGGRRGGAPCYRGQFCAFAHTRNEIRCQLFCEESELDPSPSFFMMEFKTCWCPYGTQHDWHGCLYAHTYQDCRRSPRIGYGSEPCPYWQKDLHSVKYRKRCPFGTRCPYSHGSKEQLYHPAYYKTMPCADYKARKACPRGRLCAFYHDLSEKRTPASDASSYDYSKPLPTALMTFLQPNFMSPPLFNLDDFEAFGHAR